MCCAQRVQAAPQLSHMSFNQSPCRHTERAASQFWLGRGQRCCPLPSALSPKRPPHGGSRAPHMRRKALLHVHATFLLCCRAGKCLGKWPQHGRPARATLPSTPPRHSAAPPAPTRLRPHLRPTHQGRLVAHVADVCAGHAWCECCQAPRVEVHLPGQLQLGQVHPVRSHRGAHTVTFTGSWLNMLCVFGA